MKCCDRIAIPTRRTRGTRRRGSVLILVTALLGMLFVMGVAFMGTMNFLSETIESERLQAGSEDGVDGVSEEICSLLANGILPDNSAPFGTAKLYDAPFSSFAELPGYHNIFSPIEANYDSTYQQQVYEWVTDIESLKNDSFTGSWLLYASTDDLPVRYDPGTYDPEWNRSLVDADGDGIADSFQFDISQVLDISDEQLAQLRQLVNTEDNPAGAVYLGVRIVPHGGMVNLNDSHISLIGNILDRGTYDHGPSLPGVDRYFYSPLSEEHLLRRRNLLPPRVVPPSRLHGNMFLDSGGDADGEGDIARQIFPDGESVFEGDHRYYPFTNTEGVSGPDGNPTLWEVRMSADRSYEFDPSGEEYDRRHLLTTIGHDDLLARGAVVEVPDIYTGVPSERDIRDVMLQWNRQVGGLEVDRMPFEYINYPHDLEVGSNCEVPSMMNCRLDPRHGRLQLSLPWLEDAVTDGLLSEYRMTKLIQDVFTIMLFNASGPAWDDRPINYDGNIPVWAVDGLNGECVDGEVASGTTCYDPQLYYVNTFGQQQAHTHRLAQIARTAASLTANLIDFMDADHIPTRVEIRSVDFSDVTTYKAGSGIEQPAYVFGLERQPYITEVAIDHKDVTVTTDNNYAIELFNPYDEDFTLPAGEYSIRVFNESDNYNYVTTLGSPTIPAKGTLVLLSIDDPQTFQTPQVQGSSIIAGTPFALYEGYKVYLTRTVTYVDPLSGNQTDHEIVLDQFEVSSNGAYFSNLLIGYGGVSPVFSIERPSVSDETPWMAPLPGDSTFTNIEVHSLGAAANISTQPERRPVEIRFANTGSFKTAFPTTGSLLLLMRVANREWLDRVFTEQLAFTTQLGGKEVGEIYSPVSQGPELREVDRHRLIDNGRMPVFDLPHAHHVDPALVAAAVNPGDPRRPGELENLPWGADGVRLLHRAPAVQPGTVSQGFLESGGTDRPGRRPARRYAWPARPRAHQHQRRPVASARGSAAHARQGLRRLSHGVAAEAPGVRTAQRQPGRGGPDRLLARQGDRRLPRPPRTRQRNRRQLRAQEYRPVRL